MLPLQIHQEQMVMSHSPLKMFQQFHNKTVLVSGQGPVREIARNLGFQKVVTIDNFRKSYPLLDMVDHNRRGHDEVCICTGHIVNEKIIILYVEVIGGNQCNQFTEYCLVVYVIFPLIIFIYMCSCCFFYIAPVSLGLEFRALNRMT